MLKLLAHGVIKLRFIHHHVLKLVTKRLGRLDREMGDMPPYIHVEGFTFFRIRFEKFNRRINDICITPTRGTILCIALVTINDINTVCAILSLWPNMPFTKMTGAIPVPF